MYTFLFFLNNNRGLKFFLTIMCLLYLSQVPAVESCLMNSNMPEGIKSAVGTDDVICSMRYSVLLDDPSKMKHNKKEKKRKLKKMSKSMQIECKKTAEISLKEGWVLYDSDMDMELAIYDYFEVLATKGAAVMPICGYASELTKERAVNRAKHRGNRQYVAFKESHVQNITVTEVTNMAYNMANETKTNFESFSVSTSTGNIRNFQPKMILYRQKSDKSFEVRAYYIVEI